MKTLLALLVLSLTLAGCNIPVDKAMAAAEGNDYSVVFSGYGVKASKGYLFLPIKEGASAEGVIKMTFPKVDCTRDACIRYQFFKDGTPVLGGSILKGQQEAAVVLQDLLIHKLIEANDEGEFAVAVQVFYISADGREYSVSGKGFVRVNVLNPKFTPMACGDPATAWTFKIATGCEVQFTTAFRSAVCGDGCT